MYLSSLTHRDELFDLTMRWLNDDLYEDDGRTVSEIFLNEGYISGAYVIPKMIDLLQNIFGGSLRLERIRQKHDLRARLIQYMDRSTRRTEDLVRTFQENPEMFFPHVSIDAILGVTHGKRLVSIGRIKRLSRVAEKITFRIMNAIVQDIKAEAGHIAEMRSMSSGSQYTSIINPSEIAQEDFFAAEKAIAARFRRNTMRFRREDFAVNDMLGFKIIGEPEELEVVMNRLKAVSDIKVVEIQEHTGKYNAINMLIDFLLPAPDKLIHYFHGVDWTIASRRGLNPHEVQLGLPSYLEKGSRTVRMEISLTTYPELMESEFGRSLHEVRILELREQKTYKGYLAQNAGYLVEYLLSLAMAPVFKVNELPIKLYGRYLPETIASLKSALYGNNIDGSLLNAFCLMENCRADFCLLHSERPFSETLSFPSLQQFDASSR